MCGPGKLADVSLVMYALQLELRHESLPSIYHHPQIPRPSPSRRTSRHRRNSTACFSLTSRRALWSSTALRWSCFLIIPGRAVPHRPVRKTTAGSDTFFEYLLVLRRLYEPIDKRVPGLTSRSERRVCGVPGTKAETAKVRNHLCRVTVAGCSLNTPAPIVQWHCRSSSGALCPRADCSEEQHSVTTPQPRGHSHATRTPTDNCCHILNRSSRRHEKVDILRPGGVSFGAQCSRTRQAGVSPRLTSLPSVPPSSTVFTRPITSLLPRRQDRGCLLPSLRGPVLHDVPRAERSTTYDRGLKNSRLSLLELLFNAGQPRHFGKRTRFSDKKHSVCVCTLRTGSFWLSNPEIDMTSRHARPPPLPRDQQ